MTAVIRYGICWRLIVQDSEGNGGGTAQDNRRSINGVFWILHTGAHGGGCRRATGNGVLYISIFADEPDLEWPMIDVSHCKVHPHPNRKELQPKAVAGRRSALVTLLRRHLSLTRSILIMKMVRICLFEAIP